MTKIAVVAGGQLETLPTDVDIWIGVDRGSLYLIDREIDPDLAVGDFDSVTQDEFQRIQEKAGAIIQAQPEKDDTDLELAVIACFERYPDADLMIYGAFGGRLDHALANVFLPSNPAISPFMERIFLVDEQNVMTYRPSGKHLIDPVDSMKYIAFMPTKDIHLTIEGAKYPLNETNFFFKKVYASNEFIGKPISLSFDSGYVVIIYSKDRK